MHHNSSQWQTYKCVGSGLWKFRIFLQTIGTDGKDTFRGVSLGGLGTPDSAYQVPQIREHKTPKTLGSRNSIQFIHTARRRKTRWIQRRNYSFQIRPKVYSILSAFHQHNIHAFDKPRAGFEWRRWRRAFFFSGWTDVRRTDARRNVAWRNGDELNSAGWRARKSGVGTTDVLPPPSRCNSAELVVQSLPQLRARSVVAAVVDPSPDRTAHSRAVCRHTHTHTHTLAGVNLVLRSRAGNDTWMNLWAKVGYGTAC